jgi:hypothetical protein
MKHTIGQRLNFCLDQIIFGLKKLFLLKIFRINQALAHAQRKEKRMHHITSVLIFTDSLKLFFAFNICCYPFKLF